MLRNVISSRLYNSITQHNRLLFDYSKGESESKGIYLIYVITLPLHPVMFSISELGSGGTVKRKSLSL